MSKIMYGMARRRVRLPIDVVEQIEKLPGEDFSEKMCGLLSTYFELINGNKDGNDTASFSREES